MAFSPLPSSLEEALKEIKMWRETYTKQKFTPQPAQKPLTYEQMNALWFDTNKQHGSVIWRFARAIEAAHGIKE